MDGRDHMKKAAVIVLFNPDTDRLLLNINAVVNQVDKLILVDNADSKAELDEIIDKYKIEYISDYGNKGIAYALNRAVEYCCKNGFDWLLTLDQDSVCPADIVETYEKYIDDDVAIITCAINYNNQELLKSDEEYSYIDECITSAAFTNVEICKSLGGFDEQMFIDRVDFEYCYRVRKAGYKMLRVNTIVLDHNLGDLKLKKVGNQVMRVGGHSSFRKFYIAQNTVYCQRKHPDIISKSVCNKKLIKLIVKTMLYESNKYKKIKSIIKGIKSGKKMKLGVDHWIS